MKPKRFDCVEMKHRGAEKVQKKISGMSRKEELAYWQESYKRLQDRQKKLQGKSGLKENVVAV